MPELRKDPIIGRWVIISTERSKRPQEFGATKAEVVDKTPCPFCEGNEHLTPPEIFAVRDINTKPNKPGWKVRVVPSVSPILGIEGNLDRRGHGIYDVMNGIGAHEIIIETPQHISSLCELDELQIANAISAYVERIFDLEKDKRFKYILIFKNYGAAAGSTTIRHCRSQLIALPVNPKNVKEELVGARRYFEYKERCVFCDIIKQEITDAKRLILDINGFIAITPFASRFPFEMWILPKEHSCDFANIKKSEIAGLATTLKQILTRLNRALNDPPYNFVIHTAPFRRPKAGYWKTIDQDFHWHIEVMPRLTRVAGFEWGTGFYINPTLPEEAAKYLRELEV